MSLNVTYKAFDRHSLDERQKLTPLFWEYWFRVNKQDLSNMVEVELQGETQTITSAEMMIFWYLYRGFDFQLCLVDGGIAGFLIYHVVCTHVLEVRGIFVESKFWNSGFGQGLVLSLPTDIKKVVFQTRASIPPEQFLKQIEGKPKEIGRVDDLITWEMEWKNG